MYTWLTWKEESHVSPMFIFLIIGFLLIVIPGAMLTLNLQHSYQDLSIILIMISRMHYIIIYSGITVLLVSRYKDSLNYHEMEQLHSRTTGILTVISNIQEKMVQESEGQPGKPAVSASQIIQTKTGQEILYRELSRPFEPRPARVFLMPGCSTRKELNSSMAEYESYLTSNNIRRRFIEIQKNA